jgi:lysosomal alpha-mannosidase
VNKRQETEKSEVNVFYSTPECYLYSLNQADNKWPVKHDDFFPYAKNPHGFWTGFFTSRPTLKYYIRTSSMILQSIRHMIAFSGLNDAVTNNAVFNLERAASLNQHHDAVTGTQKQHVAYDYAKRLSIGVAKCEESIAENVLNRLKLVDGKVNGCPLLNVSQCSVSESSDKFSVIIYNQLARKMSQYVRVPVVEQNMVVYFNNEVVSSEYVPIYNETKSLPERQSIANYELVFRVVLEPLAFQVYDISKAATKLLLENDSKSTDLKDDEFTFTNENLMLTFDSSGNLNNIQNTNDPNVKVASGLKQHFCIYDSMPGNNTGENFKAVQASGAYVFRPRFNTPKCLNVLKFTVTRRAQFDEIHQVYNDWISQTIRLYKGTRNAEFQWQVGPIDVSDGFGKEIVIKFYSDLKSNSTFYTDSNGREMLKRVRDFRPTWKLEQTENVSGNYYPINSRIFIKDQLQSDVYRQLTVLTDRSHGGSSIEDGSIEIMLHRRTLTDDSLGSLKEPLNEPGTDGRGLISNGKVNVVFETAENSARVHRELAHRINNQPLVMFHQTKQNEVDLSKKFFAVSKSLPENLHLLTLMREYDIDNISNDEVSLIVRIEHFYEIGEDSVLSQPVSVDLKDFFADSFVFIKYEELSLGANMKVEELSERLKWKTNLKQDKREDLEREKQADNDYTFTFKPMQIRTFRFWLKTISPSTTPAPNNSSLKINATFGLQIISFLMVLVYKSILTL